ncbi:MAG: RNA polymerase factor sigma-54 [Gammaproteobacteria bacterium]|nr:MAG: RNA polymerase factor sigma-54 [Gammaproteobacteria bacterium]
MKQTLSLKLGQQLTMTPQLQQAIRLLQLSSLDLQQEIQETLESNPMLELEEEESTPDGNEIHEPAGERLESDASSDGLDEADDFPELPGEGDTLSADSFDDAYGDAGEGIEVGDLDVVSSGEATEPSVSEAADEAPIPDDLPVDTSWDDIYEPGSAPSSGSAEDLDWSLDDRNSSSETLQDHLLWQLNLTPMSDRDRMIATAIIDAVEPDGMLSTDIEDLLITLNADEPADADPETLVELDEVLAVLKRVQQFDPIGVCARDLGESLTLQLSALDLDTPWRSEALSLVSEHLDLLAGRDFNTLKRRTRLDEADLASVVSLIQSMNPRPGSSIGGEAPEYIVPDVMVFKDNGRWQVELNGEATPKLKINELYASMVKRADSSADNVYLKDNLQEARWFLKSLQSRHETLLKVATQIVEHQRGFLEYGEEAMKPLVLADIAEAVEMHESTISRVTSRKYMHTPRGIFELKYFFSSHVSTASGGEVSSTAIRALIRKLTADENPRKPLSDNKIAAILAEQNIKVARRTVAKYRESMAIPPSNERKRLV